ncbi:MAG: DUF1674 domain-containing protein [Pseudomonadota bacterium]|nr:DUF1674 domain-containing protein [Pseudomonadota bacterium]
METEQDREPAPVTPSLEPAATIARQSPPAVEEIGGPKGLEPTRYGDWERRGRCIDF